MSYKLYFGIDLGTTNSVIAVHNGTKVEVMTLKEGHKTLPSCVMYDKGNIIVGTKAYAQRYKTEKVVYSCKRDMGTNKEYSINDGERKFKVTPVEVSSEILKELKRQAEEKYEIIIEDIVITVPAYFTNTQKQDTFKAGELAGFKNIRLAVEPSAAALAYTPSTKKVEKVIVYDLGGGTFDVSSANIIPANQDADIGIFSSQKGKSIASVEITGIDGNNKLGGDDVDNNIYKIICKKLTETFKKKYAQNKNFSFNREATPEERERILLECERLKKLYSETVAGATIPVTIILKDGTEVRESASLTSADLAEAFFPIFERTMKCFSNLLNNSSGEFDRIVLIGGSTKFFMFKRALSEMYPNVEIYDSISPDFSVAIGAATIAAADNSLTPINLDDVVSQNIGIRVTRRDMGVDTDDVFEPLIFKNSVLPAKGYKGVKTARNDQTTVSLDVFEGSNGFVEDNAYIGSIFIDDIVPKAEDVLTNIFVSLNIDRNGLLKITAKYDGLTKNLELKNLNCSSTHTGATDLTPEEKEQQEINQKKYNRFMKLFSEVDLTGTAEMKAEQTVLIEEIKGLGSIEWIKSPRVPEFLELVKELQMSHKVMIQAKKDEFIAQSEEHEEEYTEAMKTSSDEMIPFREVITDKNGNVLRETTRFSADKEAIYD